jgi:hypothetical protein
MRFIFESNPKITMNKIESGLKSVDPGYTLTPLNWGRQGCEDAELFFKGELYGQVELNQFGQEEIDEELEELIEDVECTEEATKDEVLRILKKTRVMFVIHVLWQGRDAELTLKRLEPLWEWLFKNYRGLLQADGEGYYNEQDLILKVE